MVRAQAGTDAAERMIRLVFGGPEWAGRYDEAELSSSDRPRAPLPRSPRAEREWRVSRALAARLRRECRVSPDSPVMLSHSAGHALVALAPPGVRIGVDLERCRPRDVAALAQWVCSSDERQALAEQPSGEGRLRLFYLLWTLKEALVKAADLAFPADMARVGLRWRDGEPVLVAPAGRWRAEVHALGQEWVAAVVWDGEAALDGSDWKTERIGAWDARLQ